MDTLEPQEIKFYLSIVERQDSLHMSHTEEWEVGVVQKDDRTYLCNGKFYRTKVRYEWREIEASSEQEAVTKMIEIIKLKRSSYYTL
ncbi:hypothetical protein [Tumebacillus avium]|uniref:hypothetical protein n=1 Tax=Tumebacillus avium TaxID=1903704 RepID=UPI0018DF5E50|nr:hypothetical protein [Tumebacillus avium]